MVCSSCAALPHEVRRHPPSGWVPAPPENGALGALICDRCGTAHRASPASTLVDTLVRLERAGLGVAGPLLGSPPGLCRA
jgi:hypothetical protein